MCRKVYSERRCGHTFDHRWEFCNIRRSERQHYHDQPCHQTRDFVNEFRDRNDLFHCCTPGCCSAQLNRIEQHIGWIRDEIMAIIGYHRTHQGQQILAELQYQVRDLQYERNQHVRCIQGRRGQ